MATSLLELLSGTTRYLETTELLPVVQGRRGKSLAATIAWVYVELRTVIVLLAELPTLLM